MKKNTRIIVIIIAILAVVAGGWGTWTITNATQTKQSVSSEAERVISYDGEEGKSAYEILKSKYEVEATEGSFGVMVSSINGLKATTTEFWLYSVNGTQPDVAADKYQTHAGDKITWDYKGM